MDRALEQLAADALGGDPKIAVVAVGGYGRGELSPHSDIDLLFLLPDKRDAAEVSKATLRNLLYPLWDGGFQVGHWAGSPNDAVGRAGNDVHAATTILTARLVAGAPEAFEEFTDRRARWVLKQRKTLLRRIVEVTEERHAQADAAGWTLAPDLKNDVGGLRDVHALQWLLLVAGDGPISPDLNVAQRVLLAVREALHTVSPRKLDRIRIDLQASVAARLGLERSDGRDVMMAAVHSAARTIEHQTGLRGAEVLGRATGGPRRAGTVVEVDQYVRLIDGELVPRSGIPEDTTLALQVLAALAQTGRPLAARTISWMSSLFETSAPGAWDQQDIEAFLRVLRGPHAERTLQLMDHIGAWPTLIPEWTRVRGRAQHDPYHRFTVDGHSFVAITMLRTSIEKDRSLRAAADEAGNLGSLYIATLLHDMGKGSGEDHSVAGERLARTVCDRMGLSHETKEEIAFLVRHHLLLSDTATRRDLDDGSVIASVAQTVSKPRLLRLLYILSAADGRATGKESWNDWKALLVAELYRKTLIALESGALPPRADVGARLRELTAYDPIIAASAERVLETLPPSYLSSTGVEDMAEELRLLMDPPGPTEVTTHVSQGADGEHTSITVCSVDRLGSMARTTGVFALQRLPVLRAQAYSTTDGLALQRYLLASSEEHDWSKLAQAISDVYGGRLALEARLDQKRKDYVEASPIDLDVRFLQEESEHSTVLEVRATDVLGLLHALTSALSDLGLDIHVAKIDTLGERVVDVFYVRAPDGRKLDDIQAREAKLSIEHRVQNFYS